MKTSIENILTHLQRSILNNLESIRDLMKQWKEIKDLVEKISGDSGNNQEIKIRLESQLKQTEETINKLIDQTKEIGNSYTSLINNSL